MPLGRTVGSDSHLRRKRRRTVAIGKAGLYDEWRRLRVEPGLKGLAEGQAPARDYEEDVEESAVPPGLTQRKHAGKGRVVYIPARRV